MKQIILCEGKTDAILIGYFLIKTFGWKYTKRQVLGLPADRDNEVLNWYQHPEKPKRELAIWGVGSIDQISAKLRHITERTQNERTPANRFGRVVLFFDRNDKSEDQCRDLLEEWVTESGLEVSGDLQLGEWKDATIVLPNKTPEEDHQLRILPIVLPTDSEGNLEIFLMNALKEQSCHDRQLVDEAEKFIDCLPDEPYLSKKRYRPKACLGSILSVMSPDWVFSKLDERLTRVQWEKLESVMTVYGKLSEL